MLTVFYVDSVFIGLVHMDFTMRYVYMVRPIKQYFFITNVNHVLLHCYIECIHGLRLICASYNISLVLIN